jgi:uncharacterized protein DUF4174
MKLAGGRMKNIMVAGLIALIGGTAVAQDVPVATQNALIDAPDVSAVAPVTDTTDGAEDAAPAFAAIEALGRTLDEFKWVSRLIVVFADSDQDPAFAKQMTLLQERTEELLIRDVVVLFDTSPAARGDIRQDLRPRGFSLVLINKEGRVELRKPKPWSVREINRSIDKMPLRQQEIRDRAAGN